VKSGTIDQVRKGDRVVEGTGLENRQGVKAFEGSNPSSSAIEIVRSFDRAFSIPEKNDRSSAVVFYF
jgi:hypothetical protein